MAFIVVAASLVLAGVAMSLIDVETTTSHTSYPDYHFVPFAGDVLGA